MIALVRIDNRLLHGQILEAWLPRLGADEVVVVDDDAARSPLARAAMTLCLPPELPANIVALEDVDFAKLASSRSKVVVLLRDVPALVRAHARGLTPALAPTVNLGNVHFGPDRRPCTPSVFLDAPDVAALRALVAAGFQVEARAIPSEPPAGMEEIERRYAQSR